MASSILGSLATGLRGAGATLSPQVFQAEQNFGLQRQAQDNRMQMAQFERTQQLEQEKALATAAGPYLQKGDLQGAAQALATVPGGFSASLKLLDTIETRKARAQQASEALDFKMADLERKKERDLQMAKNEDEKRRVEEWYKQQTVALRENAAALKAIASPKDDGKTTVIDGVTVRIPNGWMADPSAPNGGIKQIPNYGFHPDDPNVKKGFDIAIDRMKAGDPNAFTGFARSKELMQGLYKRIGERATEEGWNGADLASAKARFRAVQTEADAAGRRAAAINLTATEAVQLGKIAKQASDKWNRSNIRSFNEVKRLAVSQTADPELREFAAAVNGFVSMYARAVNPQGVATDEQRQKAFEILQVSFSKGDFARTIDMMLREVNALKAAPGPVIEEAAGRIPGQTGTLSPGGMQKAAPQNQVIDFKDLK